MKLMRGVSIAAGAIMILVGVAAYLGFVHLAGFPDGYLSALGRIQWWLFGIYSLLAVAQGVQTATGGRGLEEELLRIRLKYSIGFFAMVSLVVLLLNWYASLHLDAGGGG